VEGEEGKFAEIRVLPLRAGAEERSVELWREELRIADTNQIKKTEVEVAGLKGNVYDLSSSEPIIGDMKARTLAAMVPREDTLWVVKMSGEESLVAQQEQAFHKFLKSLQFHEEAHDDESATAEKTAAAPSQNWKTPATWKQQTPGQMVLAAYTATKGSGTADITVTSLSGEGGGLLGNVNRWRGQVRLAPTTAADLEKEVKTIDLAGGSKASVVDVVGTNPKTGKAGRLYVLVVPRGGQTWFYKMVGDPDVVTAETANLAEFAATAH
jgi:hypothetical protein